MSAGLGPEYPKAEEAALDLLGIASKLSPFVQTFAHREAFMGPLTYGPQQFLKIGSVKSPAFKIRDLSFIWRVTTSWIIHPRLVIILAGHKFPPKEMESLTYHLNLGGINVLVTGLPTSEYYQSIAQNADWPIKEVEPRCNWSANNVEACGLPASRVRWENYCGFSPLELFLRYLKLPVRQVEQFLLVCKQYYGPIHFHEAEPGLILKATEKLIGSDVVALYRCLGHLNPGENNSLAARGKVEVITGPVLSQKSFTLAAKIQTRTKGQMGNNKSVRIYTALQAKSGEGRRSRSRLVPHYQPIPVEDVGDILADVSSSGGVTDVYIDEAQVLGIKMLGLASFLTQEKGINVTLAFYPTKGNGEPFENVAGLYELADVISPLLGSCHVCGQPGSKSQAYWQDGENETDLAPVAYDEFNYGSLSKEPYGTTPYPLRFDPACRAHQAIPDAPTIPLPNVNRPRRKRRATRTAVKVVFDLARAIKVKNVTVLLLFSTNLLFLLFPQLTIYVGLPLRTAAVPALFVTICLAMTLATFYLRWLRIAGKPSQRKKGRLRVIGRATLETILICTPLVYIPFIVLASWTDSVLTNYPEYLAGALIATFAAVTLWKKAGTYYKYQKLMSFNKK